MKNFCTPLIQEKIHYDAKLSAVREIWQFQTHIILVSL